MPVVEENSCFRPFFDIFNQSRVHNKNSNPDSQQDMVKV